MAKHTKTKLNKLELAELLQIAMTQFGLAPGDDWEKERLVNEILEAQTVEHEKELDEEASKTSGRRVRIKIANGEGVNGKSDVFFSHNGRQYLAKRNKPLELPEEHLCALTDAVMTVYEDEHDDEGKVTRRVPRDVPRYNIQILGYLD